MKGTIEADSRPGEGAVFAVTLPVRGTLPPPDTYPDAPLAGRNVLIVSPNQIEARAIARTVSAHGGAARCLPDADRAAAMLAEGDASFNTLLIDAMIEDDAGSVLRRLKEAAGRDGIAAVTLIAPNDRGRMAEIRQAGYGTFLARPVRGETLIRVLSPAAGRPALERVRRTAGRTGNRPEATRLKVLLAEDNQVNALLAKAALEKAGHRVEVVGDGQSAVNALAGGSERFDIVLMDLHMPVLDGADAIAAIRAREEERGTRPLPILVLTADGQEGTRHSVLARGADGFITKPLDPASLVATVEQKCAA
jgi:CheY-like chemotaxis protein